MEIAIGVCEEEEEPRLFALVSHLAIVLNMSVSSIKGYLERDIGQVIVKDVQTLKHLKHLGAIGLTATSAAIFPLERLMQALSLAKGPDKDLIKRIASLKVEAWTDSCDNLSHESKNEEEGFHEEEDNDEKEEEEEDDHDEDEDEDHDEDDDHEEGEGDHEEGEGDHELKERTDQERTALWSNLSLVEVSC